MKVASSLTEAIVYAGRSQTSAWDDLRARSAAGNETPGYARVRPRRRSLGRSSLAAAHGRLLAHSRLLALAGAAGQDHQLNPWPHPGSGGLRPLLGDLHASDVVLRNRMFTGRVFLRCGSFAPRIDSPCPTFGVES